MKRVSIILVEDSAPDVMLVREALKTQHLDFLLDQYGDGEKAARAFAAMTAAPDLVLMDLNIPHIRGLELLRIIRASPLLKQTPVAILTSSETPSDRIQSQHSGANAYIVKPQGYYEFVDRVGTAVRDLVEHPTGGNGSLAH